MHFSVLLSVLTFTLSVFASPLKLDLPSHKGIKVRQQAYTENGVMVVNNNLGQARGVPIGDGSVFRFTVKYATAQRWATAVKASAWTMFNNDPFAMPPVCPSGPSDPAKWNEDCLYMVLYVPASVLNTVSTAPVYVWFHGGSFAGGSASEAGVDGSGLAKKFGGIVAVVQYRLGALGFLPPTTAGSGAVNLGVKDVITALDFIKTTMSFFGGNNQVTVGGQSSGGHMVRALLAAPSANNLFRAGILHGDPMNVAFQKPSAQALLQSAFYSQFNCSNSNLQCLKNLPVSTIINTEANWLNNGGPYFVDPSVGGAEMIRPVLDGTTIVYSLTTSLPPTKKPLMLTTNHNEGGQAVGGMFPPGLPLETFYPILAQTIGDARAQKIRDSPYYNPDPAVTINQPYVQNGDTVRQAFEREGTDQNWRCANWDFARRWTAGGGKAWVGQLMIGKTYVDNTSNDYCTAAGLNRVCHEDDKFIIFGTTPSPTADQTATSNNLMTRVAKFIQNPTPGPNAAGLPNWTVAGTVDVHPIQIGGASDGQNVPVDACDPSFWGADVQFDWQINGA